MTLDPRCAARRPRSRSRDGRVAGARPARRRAARWPGAGPRASTARARRCCPGWSIRISISSRSPRATRTSTAPRFAPRRRRCWRRCARARPGRTAGRWVRGEGLDESALGRLPTRRGARRGGAAASRAPAASQPARVGAERPRARAPRRARRASSAATAARRASSHGEERAVSARARAAAGARRSRTGLVRPARELAGARAHHASPTPRRARWRELAPLRAPSTRGRVPLRVFAMRRAGRVARGRRTGRLRPGPVKLMVEEGPDGLRPTAAALARRIAARPRRAARSRCIASARRRWSRRSRLRRAAARRASRGPASARARRRVSAAARRSRSPRSGSRSSPTPPSCASAATCTGARRTASRWGWLYRARSLARRGRAARRRARTRRSGRSSPWIGHGGGADAAHAVRRACWARASASPPRRRSRSSRRGAARRARRADALGRLRPGGPADLIVVEPDPLRAPADEVAAHRVRADDDRRGDRMARREAVRDAALETRGPVAIVTLDRPECLNAYNVAMRDDLYAVLGGRRRRSRRPRRRAARPRARVLDRRRSARVRQRAVAAWSRAQVRWRRDVWGRLLAAARRHRRRGARARRRRRHGDGAALRPRASRPTMRASRCRRRAAA